MVCHIYVNLKKKWKIKDVVIDYILEQKLCF